MKKHILIYILSIILMASCQDFLEEEQVGVQTQEQFETEAGMEDLIRGCYSALRFKTGYDHCFMLWNIGTDEFTQGDQEGPDGGYGFNYYGTEINADNGHFALLWEYNYRAINNCNVGIERIPLVENAMGIMKDQDGKNQRMAELRFLRAYYYFMMVQQFGGIPLSTEPVAGLRLEWPRASVAEVYNVIIDDWTFAAKYLPETQDVDYGRATANAARHYLAKAYLTRASAVTEDRGKQPDDLDNAAYYADQCLPEFRTLPGQSPNRLLDNYKDIWDPDKQTPGEGNTEVLFATQFDIDQANLDGSGPGYQNRTHLFWLNRYDVGEPGMTRNIQYGRPYRRMMITDYAVDIHDRYNDSRLRKGCLEVFYSTEINQALAPKWTAEQLLFAFTNVASDGSWAIKPNGDTIYTGDYKFTVATAISGDTRNDVILGDTALVFLINDEHTTLTDREIISKGYGMYVRYFWRTDDSRTPVELMHADLTIGGMTIRTWIPGKTPSLYKYIDKERITFDSERGTRDVFNARLGETYLIAAEAYGRMDDYASAAQRLNVLRQRAAYHAGEVKPSFWAEYDGGTQGNTASTEAAMELTASYWNDDVPLEQYPDGVNSPADRFIHFMLNERCRELLGEMLRWEDLVRTETLYQRCYAFNPEVALQGTMREHHKLRPIPRTHIELIQTNGRPLTADERQAYQNPGY